jgi:transposase
MEITEAQYERIKDALPVQRGNVRLSNLQVLNAVLYVAEQGCKWRGLPKRFGRWHTIYTRMNRWSKNGVHGYRVIATDDNFYSHYRYRRDQSLSFAQGHAPEEIFDVVLGAPGAPTPL